MKIVFRATLCIESIGMIHRGLFTNNHVFAYGFCLALFKDFSRAHTTFLKKYGKWACIH